MMNLLWQARRAFHVLTGRARTPDPGTWSSWSTWRIHRFLRSKDLGVETPSRRLIRDLLRQWPGARLLDAACGPVVEYEGYRKHHLDLSYTGLDLTHKMLREARRRFPEVRVVSGSITQMPFRDAEFDIVIARHILEHLRSYERAVEECVRVARKAVVINFFIAPSAADHDQVTTRGTPIYNNEYSRRKFESYVASLRRVETCDSFWGLEKSPPLYTSNAVYVIRLTPCG